MINPLIVRDTRKCTDIHVCIIHIMKKNMSNLFFKEWRSADGLQVLPLMTSAPLPLAVGDTIVVNGSALFDATKPTEYTVNANITRI